MSLIAQTDARPGSAVPPLSPNPPSESIVRPGYRVYALPPQLPGKIVKHECIGGGTYSDVHRGVWEQPTSISISVAIKCIRKVHLYVAGGDRKRAEEKFLKIITRETVIWQTATHENILPFYGYQIIDDEPMLISPWCVNGSLASYIQNHPGLRDQIKLELLRDAARGLEFLHSMRPPIAHGDIKPENIIINDGCRGALCDFGVSRIMTSVGTHTGLTTSGGGEGTAAYQANELFDGESLPTDMSDVYAFGGLVLATMTGNPPFYKTRKASAIIVLISKGEIAKPSDHPEIPEQDPLWELLRSCWRPEPCHRPSMNRVISELESHVQQRLLLPEDPPPLT